MNKKELRSVIKSIVAECVNEVLAEKFVKEIVERAVVPQQAHAPQKHISKESLRRKIAEDIAPKSNEETDMLTELYQDSIEKTLPLEEQGVQVSEDVMEKMGLMEKDYSKYL